MRGETQCLRDQEGCLELRLVPVGGVRGTTFPGRRGAGRNAAKGTAMCLVNYVPRWICEIMDSNTAAESRAA